MPLQRQGAPLYTTSIYISYLYNLRVISINHVCEDKLLNGVCNLQNRP